MATMTRLVCTSSLEEPESWATKLAAAGAAHENGWATHLDVGRRDRPLERGKESTKAR
jgi:hypothetical protein